GVLVLCLGQATRLSEYLLGEDKTYEGTLRLGQRTTTDDAEGEGIAEAPVPTLDEATLRALEARFSGTLQQVPPQFSAIKQAGQRAYALARRGEAVQLAPRAVTIHAIRLRRDLDHPEQLHLHVHCSAGTYIRALARDIGEALGCGAHLIALRRTRSGEFSLSNAHALADVERAAAEGALDRLLVPMDRALHRWPATHLSAAQAQRLRQGQKLALDLSAWSPGALGRVYDESGIFLAIARWDGRLLVPVKVFNAAS
ncbi:MAG: tRNA pseudouridine(55) synthase TruB, partial [Thermoflexales bacterium]|nr:tRNA pseudouridine(55) synthase TruB [Thermoflexales bacterium]